LVPAGAIADHRVSAEPNLRADLLQLLVHGLGVDDRRDDGRTRAARRTDGTEQMNLVMTIVPHHRGILACMLLRQLALA
jgi:hypothetical protein